MKKESIKKYLKPYSILSKRKTTINHAFASALAPYDDYDEEKLNEALMVLEQSSGVNLRCVYCGKDAETWDHLVGLVKDSNFSGYGHQIWNLVPCCTKCNTKKGKKNWKQFLKEKELNPRKRKKMEKRLGIYAKKFLPKVLNAEDIGKKYPKDMEKYNKLKTKIFELMKEADKTAKNVRKKIKSG